MTACSLYIVHQQADFLSEDVIDRHPNESRFREIVGKRRLSGGESPESTWAAEADNGNFDRQDDTGGGSGDYGS